MAVQLRQVAPMDIEAESFKIITAEFGREAVYDVPQPCMAAEDFSFYLNRVPGSFIWLGLNPDPNTAYPALHNPRFNFNDEGLPLAMRLLTEVSLSLLAEKTD